MDLKIGRTEMLYCGKDSPGLHVAGTVLGLVAAGSCFSFATADIVEALVLEVTASFARLTTVTFFLTVSAWSTGDLGSAGAFQRVGHCDGNYEYVQRDLASLDSAPTLHSPVDYKVTY
jgi:hypothetical protein